MNWPLPLFGSGTPHAPQLDPVAKGRVLVAGARPPGVLMWMTLFGIAFVISFLSLFAAIVMDF